MMSIHAASTDGGRFAVRTDAAACVGAPDLGIVSIEQIACPKIARSAAGVVDEVGAVERGIALVIENGEGLLCGGQSPIREASEIERGGCCPGHVPSHLAAVGFLPDKPRVVVSDRAVAVVGEIRGIYRIIAVLAKRGRGIGGLAGIWKFIHAPRRHRVVIETRGAGIGRRCASGVRRGLLTHCNRVQNTIYRSRHRVGRATQRVSHHPGICRRTSEAGNHRPRDGRTGWGHGARGGLRIYLPAEVDHGAVHGAHEIRILRPRCYRATRMIVIAPGSVIVPAIHIERLLRGAIWLGVAIDRISIQRPRTGHVRREHGIQMRRGDVIVVIVGTPAVAAISIQFSNGLRELPGVVARIKDRDAIRTESDRASQKIARQRNWRCRRHRHERDLPHIWLPIAQRLHARLWIGDVAKITHRMRQLLLPCRDAYHRTWHQSGIWHRVAFHIKIRGVAVDAHAGLKSPKRSLHQRRIARRCHRSRRKHRERVSRRGQPQRFLKQNRRLRLITRFRQSHALRHEFIRHKLAQCFIVEKRPSGVREVSVNANRENERKQTEGSFHEYNSDPCQTI